MTQPARVALALALLGSMGCGGSVATDPDLTLAVPVVVEALPTSAPELLPTQPAAAAVHLLVDDTPGGWLPVASVVAPVPLSVLLGDRVGPEDGWIGVSAIAGPKAFGISRERLRQARAWLQPRDDGLELVFLRIATGGEADLPDHIAKLRRAPILRFQAPESVVVLTKKPEVEESEGRTLRVVLGGATHEVGDEALAALPRVNDPERPEKEGNWHTLDALLVSLGGMAGAPVMVLDLDGDKIKLDREQRDAWTVLVKRNLKGQLKVRAYGPPGDEGKAERVAEGNDVGEIRVR
jgi:hypothetical protein